MTSQANSVVDSGTVDAPPPGLFVLSRPHGSVAASGAAKYVNDPESAVAALRSGDAPNVVGALPFVLDSPAALSIVDELHYSPSIWRPSTPLNSLPTFSVPDRREGEHIDRVVAALATLAGPHAALQKVVLARALELTSTSPIDPTSLLAALVAGNPAGNGFYVDLSAAGATYEGRSLIGSSPEVLIRRRGTTVTCHPLAGSAPRYAEPQQDRASGLALAESDKDRREHAFVVDALRAGLTPLCRTLDIPAHPTLTTTPQLWHLGTPIRGELLDPGTSALELALALHPTPAVCGTPTDLAYEVIDELEGDRGFYGGAVGWCSGNGDGEWMVSIRCAELSADRRAVTAYAGGGIVAGSDPEAELLETNTKFGTVLGALGVTL